jgi:predicted ATPase
LSDVRDPEFVLGAIARALGIRGFSALPLFDRLCARLADTELLLVLDNLEQVASAAPDLEPLLDACPGVTILATSRTPLRVPKEQVFPLPPLQIPRLDPLPPLAELRENESVALLMQRARAAAPEFALTVANAAEIAEICVRLEGLPLAIELAAARLQLLSPAALLERLSAPLAVLTRGDPHLPERHRTLRDVIAWSDELISPAARSAFYCLAVFANDGEVEAAEAVCGEAASNQPVPCTMLAGMRAIIWRWLRSYRRDCWGPIRSASWRDSSGSTSMSAPR